MIDKFFKIYNVNYFQTPGSAAGESGKQKEKIKVVMDFTGRSEEDVYTALFDAVSQSS